MFKTKRKRAVVLALIAFFCTAASTYVAVDWRRLGGGFLAYFRGSGATAVASSGGWSSGTGLVHAADLDDAHRSTAELPRLAAAGARHPAHAIGGGSGSPQSDDDLFKDGDPAAGGVPPGSFVVAQNDVPGNAAPGLSSGGEAGAPEGAAPAPAGGGGGSVSSPAPAPGGLGDGGIVGTSPTPSPAPPVATPPASPTPPPPAPADAPPPAPTQSGSTDPGTPIPPPSPVAAVPEASSLAMMSLGALFLAVAATRRRRHG